MSDDQDRQRYPQLCGSVAVREPRTRWQIQHANHQHVLLRRAGTAASVTCISCVSGKCRTPRNWRRGARAYRSPRRRCDGALAAMARHPQTVKKRSLDISKNARTPRARRSPLPATHRDTFRWVQSGGQAGRSRAKCPARVRSCPPPASAPTDVWTGRDV